MDTRMLSGQTSNAEEMISPCSEKAASGRFHKESVRTSGECRLSLSWQIYPQFREDSNLLNELLPLFPPEFGATYQKIALTLSVNGDDRKSEHKTLP